MFQITSIPQWAWRHAGRNVYLHFEGREAEPVSFTWWNHAVTPSDLGADRDALANGLPRDRLIAPGDAEGRGRVEREAMYYLAGPVAADFATRGAERRTIDPVSFERHALGLGTIAKDPDNLHAVALMARLVVIRPDEPEHSWELRHYHAYLWARTHRYLVGDNRGQLLARLAHAFADGRRMEPADVTNRILQFRTQLRTRLPHDASRRQRGEPSDEPGLEAVG